MAHLVHHNVDAPVERGVQVIRADAAVAGHRELVRPPTSVAEVELRAAVVGLHHGGDIGALLQELGHAVAAQAHRVVRAIGGGKHRLAVAFHDLAVVAVLPDRLREWLADEAIELGVEVVLDRELPDVALGDWQAV